MCVYVGSDIISRVEGYGTNNDEKSKTQRTIEMNDGLPKLESEPWYNCGLGLVMDEDLDS